MPKHVVFSDRAVTSILAETQEKIKTETGGVFLGYRKGDVWYVIENADPGINATFTTSYFEYDQNYINHIINKLARLYTQPLELIGLWHRHPGSMDTFSTTDNGTNTEFAVLHPEGAISALVNIDPEFRFTVYSVTMPLKYRKITYSIGDDRIPSYLLSYRPQRDFLQLINKAESVSHEIKEKASLEDVVEPFVDIFDAAKKETPYTEKLKAKKRFSFSNALAKNVALKALTDIEDTLSATGKMITESDIDLILDTLSEDIEHLSSVGIECSIRNKNDYIELSENLLCTDIKPVVLRFYLDGENTMFCEYDRSIFEYSSGFIKESIIQHSMEV